LKGEGEMGSLALQEKKTLTCSARTGKGGGGAGRKAAILCPIREKREKEDRKRRVRPKKKGKRTKSGKKRGGREGVYQ